MRISVRVRPGSSRTSVGGRWGDDGSEVLVVRVAARAVDGAANRAVVDALAGAFCVRRSNVEIVIGVGSRDKVVEIDGDGERIGARLQELLDAS